jgi:hypothetical protein
VAPSNEVAALVVPGVVVNVVDIGAGLDTAFSSAQGADRLLSEDKGAKPPPCRAIKL